MNTSEVTNTSENSNAEEAIHTAEMPDTAKEAGKQFSRLGLSFAIGSLIIYAVNFCVTLVLQQWRPEWVNNTNISLLLSAVSMYFVGFPVVVALVRRMPKVSLPRKKMTVGQFLLALVMCYPIMYCSNLVGTILTAIIGVLKGGTVANPLLNVVTDTNMALILLYMVICAPIVEELVFRKLIVEHTVRYGQGVAIVVSGVMFGLFHGNLNQFMYAALLGMFLAFLYVKTGNIKVTIGVHMVINFFGGVVSTLMLKAVNYTELLKLTQNGGSYEELMNFYMENLPGWILFMMYTLFILVVVITGIVLLIVFRKRFAVAPGEVVIPKGRRFRTIFVNVGMIAFGVFWIGTMIVQLFR